MFMAQAAPAKEPNEVHSETVHGILQLCPGLPISLSMAGIAVFLRISSGLGFKNACEMYFEHLSEEVEKHPGSSFLENQVPLSPAAIEAQLEKNGNGTHLVRDMYSSLCVLESQQLMPVPVRALMWNVSEANAGDTCPLFSTMSLAKYSARTLHNGREELGLCVHDLHLDYSRKNAKQDGPEKEWHRRLLNGHLSCNVFVDETDARDDADYSPLSMLD